MRAFACLTCSSLWPHPPLMLSEGAHFAPDDSRCTGNVESLIPESLMSSDAAAVHRAEGIRDAAIWRAEALADEAQKAIGELYFEQKASGRAAVVAYRNVLRLERVEGIIQTVESAPMSVMRALMGAQSMLRSFEARRPCPVCRGALDHKKRCRLERLCSRILLLTSARLSSQKIRSARARRSSLRRGA